jgi:hypothetical protein
LKKEKEKKRDQHQVDQKWRSPFWKFLFLRTTEPI